MYGDLESGDKPKRILKARKVKDELEFLLEWQARSNKFVPKESVATNRELKKFCPEILMDFYEKKIVFKENK